MNALIVLVTPFNSSSSPFVVSIMTNIRVNWNVKTKNIRKNGNNSKMTWINVSAKMQKDSSNLYS
jgi:hypothetical protein